VTLSAVASQTINHALEIDEWQLVDQQFDPDQLMLKETLFSLANGFIGSRGTYEEGCSAGASCEGSYLNGVYSSEPIQYGESAYGFAKNNDKMLQVPDGKSLQLALDGHWLAVSAEQPAERSLDLRTGILSREQLFTSPSGKQLKLQSRRLVSFQRPELMAIEWTITAQNFSGAVLLKSCLNGQYKSVFKPDDPRVGEMALETSLKPVAQQGIKDKADCSYLLHQVHGADFQLLSAIAHQFADDVRFMDQQVEPNLLTQLFELHLQQGQAVTFSKYISYQVASKQAEMPLPAAQKVLQQAVNDGFTVLAAEQQQYLADFWLQSDIQISDDPALQQGLRFNLFSLVQSAGRNGVSNIGAKGLTGPGYDGHYFWDTEIYVIPTLSFCQPDTARQLLLQRFSQLDQAKNRARQMSHDKGALYPWRTISGDECSAYFPAGTAQYHINAAIAYAIRSYLLAIDDWAFIQQAGAEMLVETARLWLQLGFFSQHSGRFEIHLVTGPDEYTALVNNNFYTNAMAQLHLSFVAEVLATLASQNPEFYQSFCLRLGVSPDEIQSWQQAAELMYLPYDDKLQISAQDDSFLAKKPWDFAATPADKYPLLLHFHPLVIYRHQVLKQADLVLAMYLLDQQFDRDLKARNLAYYEPLTTHDSSLSSCIHSVAFAETGQTERAYQFFANTARMDLDNYHHNTEYGVHIACMAGSWLSVVCGFAGMRSRPEGLYFEPKLPAAWPELKFKLNYRGRVLQVQVSQKQVNYQLLSGADLTLQHKTERFSLTAGQSQLFSLSAVSSGVKS
jgi:alpha,alpha-trehalose phosphorylase